MLFVLVFYSLYLFMHLFSWSRLATQFGLGNKKVFVGYIVCAFLAFTPILAHMLPAAWPRDTVLVFWQTAFTWLGAVFYLFILQLAVLAVQTGIRLSSGHAGLVNTPKVACAVVFSSVCIVSYGFFEASRPLKVTKYQIESPDIAGDKRIVFLSDLHLGVQKSSSRVEDLISLIQAQNADMIIFGGDMFNDSLDWLEDEVDQLERLEAPLGKFGVLGNHEYYAGLQHSLDLFARAGIDILDDELIKIEDAGLTLAGVSDPTPYSRPREHQEKTTRNLLRDIDQTNFNLLVSHRPWGFDQAVRAGIDLHLAGHTHNGQIFPFRYLVRLQFEHVYGKYAKKGSKLIVTSGASSWGPPIRVMAPAEIVVVNVLRAEL